MSDTPQTDANIYERRTICRVGGIQELVELVDANNARKLERERDAISLKCGHLEDLTDTLVEELQTERRGGQVERDRIVQERDQWRECAERLAVSIAWSPLVPTKSMEAALAEFERLKGEAK